MRVPATSFVPLAPFALALALGGAGCGDDVHKRPDSGDVADGPMSLDAGVDMPPASTVIVQLLDVSDWHGQLDPNSAGGSDIGGAAVISAYWKKDRATNPNTIAVSGGDSVGATPPLSNFFDDVPAVKALNLMGLQVDTFGNHDFDSGLTRTQAIIDAAQFKYVSSNLGKLSDNLKNVDSPFTIVTTGGIKVGFVGITNEDAPGLVKPGALGTLTVDDAAGSATSAAQKARAAGAQIVVALCHLGATSKMTDSGDGGTGVTTYKGPLLDFAAAVKGVDLVFGDHTNIAVNTTVGGLPVIENLSFGQTYARVNLTYDTAAKKVTTTKVEIVTPYSCKAMTTGDMMSCVKQIDPDTAIEDMLAPYRLQLKTANDAVIATATDTFLLQDKGVLIGRVGETPLGDLVADSIRDRYQTQIAVVNGGGLRTPLPSSYKPGDMKLRRPLTGFAMGPPWDIVVGDAYAELPFGNVVVTRTVTPKQLYAIIERSVSMLPAVYGGFLQISGFKVTFKSDAPAKSRVASIALDDGTMLMKSDTTTKITLATSDFTNAGGDGYVELADGQGTSRDKMADVLRDYIKAKGTIDPSMLGSGRYIDTK